MTTISELDDLPTIQYADGGKEWYNIDIGRLHREGGLPAVEYADGDKEWWVNGVPHREGGLPAIERVNGNGDKEWWVNGQRHREGGLPAVEYNGWDEWWVNGWNIPGDTGYAYMLFCQRMQEKKLAKAQKKIYFWWIQICYDLSRPCGQRMAQKNLDVFETMMKE